MGVSSLRRGPMFFRIPQVVRHLQGTPDPNRHHRIEIEPRLLLHFEPKDRTVS